MKKTKLILAICCLIALVATVTVSFAVWDTLAASDDNISASFGENVRVEIINHKDFSNTNMSLVPSEAICGSRDTTKYTDAKFTVKFKDYSEKSSLSYTMKVLTDDDVNVTEFFDITIRTNTVNAAVTMDAQKTGNSIFEGTMSIPAGVNEKGAKTAGQAEFAFDMQFKTGAVDMNGISQIIGRSFKIKIDILAK